MSCTIGIPLRRASIRKSKRKGIRRSKYRKLPAYTSWIMIILKEHWKEILKSKKYWAMHQYWKILGKRMQKITFATSTLTLVIIKKWKCFSFKLGTNHYWIFSDVDLNDIAAFIFTKLDEMYPNNDWFIFVSDEDLEWATTEKSDWQLMIRNRTCGRDLVILK